jgi:hypothetical protein
MLVGGRFLFVRSFPARQIPNLETSPAAHESDLAFEAERFAKMFGQNEASLFIRRAMLGSGMQVARENAAIAWRNPGCECRRRAHPIKLLVRHNQQALLVGVREQNKIFAISVTPARGDGEAILFVDRVTKIAGVEGLRLRFVVHTPVDRRAILIHFPPFLTTFHASGQ